jgi:isopenicillin-N epimerase
VHEAYKRYLDYLQPGARVPHVADPRAEPRDGTTAAGREFGCDPEELAITRNASEALQIAQLGLDLKAGDEVVTTNQDYGRMLDTWEQRVRRDGITL